MEEGKEVEIKTVFQTVVEGKMENCIDIDEACEFIKKNWRPKTSHAAIKKLNLRENCINGKRDKKY